MYWGTSPPGDNKSKRVVILCVCVCVNGDSK